MQPTINIRDNKDAFLLGEAIIRAVDELSRLRDGLASWECSKTEISDRIDRLTAMFRTLKYEE